MAEGGSDEVFEKTVCGICSEIYRQPKILPCYHSFCLNCLENLVTSKLHNNKFDCPLCDTTIELPEGGVKDFPRNCYIESNLKVNNNEKHDCDLCGPDVNAMNHCTNCDENYCERCTDSHMKMKMSRNHTLISLNQEGSNRFGPFKKQFCEKHPNDEVRVVCKDCDRLLCIICKLTDHEKHNSTDITDEAKAAKEEIREKVKGAERNISKLEKLLDNLTLSKQTICSRRQSQLAKIQDFKLKIKSIFETEVNELEKICARRFNDMESDIVKRSSNIEKAIASLGNITQYLNAMTRASDDITLLGTAQNAQTRMAECVRVAEDYIKIDTEQPNQPLECSDSCTNEYALRKLAGITLGHNTKDVVNLGDRQYKIQSLIVNSDQVCSICVYRNLCVVSFSNAFGICITSAFPVSTFKTLNHSCNSLSLIERDNVFYSDIKKKEVLVLNKASGKIFKIYKSDMYPHGIAYRLNKGLQEELLVCFLKHDSEVMTGQINRGLVSAIAADGEKPAYDFLKETFAAPTRVAVNQCSGIVCLSYPSIAKVSVHDEDGNLLYALGGKDLRLVRPFGICFDNENCVVIADRDGGQVLRINMFGKLVQVLVKGNKPTAVAVGPDDKLWVGYEDINVTVYQMANEAQ